MRHPRGCGAERPQKPSSRAAAALTMALDYGISQSSANLRGGSQQLRSSEASSATSRPESAIAVERDVERFLHVQAGGVEQGDRSIRLAHEQIDLRAAQQDALGATLR